MLRIFNASNKGIPHAEQWINDGLITFCSEIEKAELVIFHGNTDITPKLRKVESNQYGTYSGSAKEEEEELFYLKKAIELGIPIIGVERGMDLISAHLKVPFVEHMQHPGMHPITTYDGLIIDVVSRHHHLVRPYMNRNVNYLTIAYAEGLSPVYLSPTKAVCLLKTTSGLNSSTTEEIETIFYPDINALCFQFNPGLLSPKGAGYRFANDLVDMLIAGTLQLNVRLEKTKNTLNSVEKLKSDTNGSVRKINEYVN